MNTLAAKITVHLTFQKIKMSGRKKKANKQKDKAIMTQMRINYGGWLRINSLYYNMFCCVTVYKDLYFHLPFSNCDAQYLKIM